MIVKKTQQVAPTQYQQSAINAKEMLTACRRSQRDTFSADIRLFAGVVRNLLIQDTQRKKVGPNERKEKRRKKEFVVSASTLRRNNQRVQRQAKRTATKHRCPNRLLGFCLKSTQHRQTLAYRHPESPPRPIETLVVFGCQIEY